MIELRLSPDTEGNWDAAEIGKDNDIYYFQIQQHLLSRCIWGQQEFGEIADTSSGYGIQVVIGI